MDMVLSAPSLSCQSSSLNMYSHEGHDTNNTFLLFFFLDPQHWLQNQNHNLNTVVFMIIIEKEKLINSRKCHFYKISTEILLMIQTQNTFEITISFLKTKT